ncbi:hypothetical protein PsYK624_157490 [Phanerochaete sordida]|uniref:DUF6534 domain-containing protein n=1 Tax=Phanerochaete sordida TaxID=48140 RepID=A0A9P3GPT3_9APHY|nr:hypothetical protein PsYK624_157490 [Phanerochaete sordida]
MSAPPLLPGTSPETPSPGGAPPGLGAMPPLDVNGTFGALLIGMIVTSILYGITVLQSFTYYQTCAEGDGRVTKSAVALLWLVDTFDMALLSHVLYFYIVTNFGNFAALAGPVVWSMSAHLMVTAATEVIVRTMFSLRVWTVSGGKWLPAFAVGFVTLLDLIFGIVVTVKSVGQTFFALEKIEAFIFTEFATGLVGDTVIALLLSYYLYQSRTGFRRTDSAVTILMAYVINTGLLTAVTLTVNIVLFATEHSNFAFVALYFVISKLYVNAYLAMLNARTGIRQRMDRASVLGPQGSHSRYGGDSYPMASKGSRSQDSQPSAKTFRGSVGQMVSAGDVEESVVRIGVASAQDEPSKSFFV